jgi:hypothetical protein
MPIVLKLKIIFKNGMVRLLARAVNNFLVSFEAFLDAVDLEKD